MTFKGENETVEVRYYDSPWGKRYVFGGRGNKDWILFFRYAEIKWRLKFRKKVRQSINLFSSSEPKAIMGGWKYT